MIAPVRPTWKDRYPLIPMERYAAWRRGDGLPFDPWLRLHERLGAGLLEVCPASMTVAGSADEWRADTDFEALEGEQGLVGAEEEVGLALDLQRRPPRADGVTAQLGRDVLDDGAEVAGAGDDVVEDLDPVVGIDDYPGAGRNARNCTAGRCEVSRVVACYPIVEYARAVTFLRQVGHIENQNAAGVVGGGVGAGVDHPPDVAAGKGTVCFSNRLSADGDGLVDFACVERAGKADIWAVNQVDPMKCGRGGLNKKARRIVDLGQ